MNFNLDLFIDTYENEICMDESLRCNKMFTNNTFLKLKLRPINGNCVPHTDAADYLQFYYISLNLSEKFIVQQYTGKEEKI